jgi:hypothetical protein
MPARGKETTPFVVACLGKYFWGCAVRRGHGRGQGIVADYCR